VVALKQKIATVVLGLLALPFYLAFAGFVSAIAVILLCPGVAALRGGCQNCNSSWCSVGLPIIIFISLPLLIIAALILTRRRTANRRASH